jgi:hypothetical protein
MERKRHRNRAPRQANIHGFANARSCSLRLLRSGTGSCPERIGVLWREHFLCHPAEAEARRIESGL